MRCRPIERQLPLPASSRIRPVAATRHATATDRFASCPGQAMDSNSAPVLRAQQPIRCLPGGQPYLTHEVRLVVAACLDRHLCQCHPWAAGQHGSAKAHSAGKALRADAHACVEAPLQRATLSPSTAAISEIRTSPRAARMRFTASTIEGSGSRSCRFSRCTAKSAGASAPLSRHRARLQPKGCLCPRCSRLWVGKTLREAGHDCPPTGSASPYRV
jgi:hypothetical protein